MTFQEHIGFICIRASPAYKQKVFCKLHTHYCVVGLAQVMVLKWEGVTLQRGDPKVCEGGKGFYG